VTCHKKDIDMKSPKITYRPEAIAGLDECGNAITVKELLQAKDELKQALSLFAENETYQDVLVKLGKVMADTLVHANKCELEAKILKQRLSDIFNQTNNEVMS